MLRRHVFITIVILGSALILTQFQNCGSTAGQGPVETSSENGEVHIADDFNKTELQFALESFQIHDEAVQTALSGLCTRKHTGARLRWGVYSEDSSGSPLIGGVAECRSGQFQVRIGGLENMVCGLDHEVVIEGDWGGVARAKVSRRCQPLASQEIEAPRDSVYGTVCSLEFHPIQDGNPPCAQVCYRDDKVVSVQSVDQAQCSVLAARLAGP
jgi:hypothetical protein